MPLDCLEKPVFGSEDPSWCTQSTNHHLFKHPTESTKHFFIQQHIVLTQNRHLMSGKWVLWPPRHLVHHYLNNFWRWVIVSLGVLNSLTSHSLSPFYFMGRQVKYLTLSERTAATTISKQRYNGTKRYVIAISSITQLHNLNNRGWTHQSSQNSKMYQQNHPFQLFQRHSLCTLKHSSATCLYSTSITKWLTLIPLRWISGTTHIFCYWWMTNCCKVTWIFFILSTGGS